MAPVRCSVSVTWSSTADKSTNHRNGEQSLWETCVSDIRNVLPFDKCLEGNWTTSKTLCLSNLVSGKSKHCWHNRQSDQC